MKKVLIDTNIYSFAMKGGDLISRLGPARGAGFGNSGRPVGVKAEKKAVGVLKMCQKAEKRQHRSLEKKIGVFLGPDLCGSVLSYSSWMIF